MRNSPPPPPAPPSPLPQPPEHPSDPPRVSEMDTISPHQIHDEPSNSVWDWSDFLDFSLEDSLTIAFDSDHTPGIPPLSESSPITPNLESSPGNSGMVRKRDPRLACSNFLAGRIPCACPEIDEKLEEEESMPGKKRPRTVRVAAGTARCQVPGCEADISELKGYHRRHRVCLRCANASAVVLDGQSKRYCQQCGKFHFLSDFDEGKRSCRRKLERHNNRRRRKPTDSKGTIEKESQQVTLADDDVCDGETGNDNTYLSSQIAELLESEGHISTLFSTLGSQTTQSNSVVTFAASGDAQIDEEKDNSKYTHSPPYCDNKSAFSSVCPTGRISFKLYDWNPAEFPRRLRHQIFQWLASMPVELEGYIRPGCTILTMFIAMPKFMWVKLFEDPVVHLHDFFVAPGNMLSGRGPFLVYLNNMIFRVMKDGTSVMRLKVEEQVPKLHYVHPISFEAGKPMEFVACGSNLLHPKFRFLVSFAGKYLAYDFCGPLCSKTEGGTGNRSDHQLFKINVPHTEPDLFGPAFIEVENESGLSNFIPILIGDKEICSEMRIMQNKFFTSLCSKASHRTPSSLCEVSQSRQTEFSEFILDTAWLLKESTLENIPYILTSSQIQRFNCLLNFLVQNESAAILARVLYHMKLVMDKSLAVGIAYVDMRPFQRNLDHATYILCHKLQKKGISVQHSGDLFVKGNCFNQSSERNMPSVVPVANQDMEVTEEGKLDAMASLTLDSTVPLLNEEVVMRVNLVREQPRKYCSRIFTTTVLTSHRLIFVIAATAVCFGVCVIVLHPQKVGEFATTIRRCLFDNS